MNVCEGNGLSSAFLLLGIIVFRSAADSCDTALTYSFKTWIMSQFLKLNPYLQFNVKKKHNSTSEEMIMI